MAGLDQARVFLVVLGGFMYWMGLHLHRHMGDGYRLTTAPVWFSTMCGNPLPGNKVARVPAVIQALGAALFVLNGLSLIGAFSIWVAAWASGISLLGGALVTLAYGNRPLEPADWVRDLLEKAQCPKIQSSPAMIRVELAFPPARVAGASIVGFVVLALTGRVYRQPLNSAGVAGLFMTLLIGLYFLTYRTELWEANDDSITHFGTHGQRSSLIWRDVTRVEFIGDNLQIVSTNSSMEVASSGNGFVGLLAFLKKRLELHKFSGRLRLVIMALPDSFSDCGPE